jgi:hypothetical protein
VSVRDVVGDQGGKVKVTWNASYRDAEGVFGVSEYRLWRSAPARAAATRVIRGADPHDGSPNLAAAKNGLYAAQGYASGTGDVAGRRAVAAVQPVGLEDHGLHVHG